MSITASRIAALMILSAALAGCPGKEGPAGPAGPASPGVTVTTEPAGANCADGGVAVQADASPTSYVCNGPSGADVQVAVEPPGGNCADGGVAISSGGGSPVYVCRGADGSDGITPTVTGEPAGSNCADGGLAVQVGAGTPSYVCNGADGLPAIVGDAGASCPYGGLSIRIGAGGTPSYVCNGAPGQDGTDGLPAIVSPAGGACPYGGIAVQIGPAGAPSYVCNGAPGADGLSVVIGDAGASCPSGGISLQVGPSGPASYVCNGTTPTITEEPAGPNCAAGGLKVQLGTATPQYVCNGTSVVLDPCVNALYGPIRDPWGATWDGSERGLSTWAAAKAACEAIGARLPVATEVLRVSAVQAGGVGETYDTNNLWTLVPVSAGQQLVGRMSDGTFSAAAADAATRLPYRCLCPTAAPAAFDEAACFGPPGAACASLPGSGGRMAIDKADRPALPYAAALWECSFVRGRLASSLQYLEAIPSGLPGGSGAWLFAADGARYDSAMVVKWTGTGAGWTPASNLAVNLTAGYSPFRCAGPTAAPTPFPTIPDEFVSSRTAIKTEQHDTSAAPWPQPYDLCLSRGGHLPGATELAELVQQGLPNGSGAWLWSSDGEGYDGIQFVQGNIQWSGTAATFQLSWNYRTDAGGRPFRCIYYPVDATYTGPAAGSCTGGCFALQIGAGPATLWLDASDRGFAPLGVAATVCANLGGHVASERDYVEAIRHGLPNGSGAWLHTSDLAVGMSTPHDLSLKWTGVSSGFTDQYPTYAAWLDPSTSAPYRCAWTNELR